MNSFLAGYFPLVIKAIDKSDDLIDGYPAILSCSQCLNENILSPFIDCCENGSQEDKQKILDRFGLSHQMHDQLFEKVGHLKSLGKVGVPNVFLDRSDAVDFIKSLKRGEVNARLLSLSFEEPECSNYLDDFSVNNDYWSINRSLARRIAEPCAEKLLGYDLIGFESNGLFHSFHCNNLCETIFKRFGLQTNAFGLYNRGEILHDVVEWLNCGDAPCEPLPWYFGKVCEV